MSLQQLRTDYAFALLTFLGGVAVCGIVPFALLRFANGQLLIGALDLGIVLSIVLNVAYIWRGGNVARAGLCVVLICSAGCVAAVMLVGIAYWMYPVLLANYLLVDRVKAGLVSAAAVATVTLHGGAFDSDVEKAMFAITALVVSVFAYLFAQRTDQMRRQLQRQAAHDPLTGASNRLTMAGELGIAIEHALRDEATVGLAVLDLDHFKQVNDDYGHDGGDRVLVEFVGLVTARTRRDDRLFRYGGEEFVLLLPGAAGEALKQRLEGLRATVGRQLRIEDRSVTVSIGGAAWVPGESSEQWLARADAAMYQAKRNGRNCVVVAD